MKRFLTLMLLVLALLAGCGIDGGEGWALRRIGRALGVDLSGGEAQKIAIARSIYKDAALFILDEPTAALDPFAEYEIFTKMNEISQDKTTIFISHRLYSCKFCDKVIVMDGGEIVQAGTHDELVHIAGKYSEMWNTQAQHYVKDGI